MSPPTRPLSRPLAFAAVLSAALYLVAEAGAWASLKVLARTRGIGYHPVVLDSVSTAHREILEKIIAGETRYIVYSRDFGWTLRPGGANPPEYSANAQGLRGADDTPKDARGVHRIAAFGDSFTHGDGVANTDAWPALLAARIGIPVLNFGVGGYGLDQAYLRYHVEGRSYRPNVVLIGLMSEDPFRHVNVYRPFYGPGTGTPLAKPRFRIDGDSLLLVPNPARSVNDYRVLLDDPRPTLERFGTSDLYARMSPKASAWDRSPLVRFVKVVRFEIASRRTPALRRVSYLEGTEVYSVTVAILDRFVSEALENGSRPLVLLLPGGNDLSRVRRGERPLYDPIRRHLDARRVAYLDLITAFEPCEGPCEVRTLIPAHYSPLGNRKVADRIAAELERLGWTKP